MQQAAHLRYYVRHDRDEPWVHCTPARAVRANAAVHQRPMSQRQRRLRWNREAGAQPQVL